MCFVGRSQPPSKLFLNWTLLPQRTRYPLKAPVNTKATVRWSRSHHLARVSQRQQCLYRRARSSPGWLKILSADITQGPGTSGTTDEQDDGGVECSAAHAMLMRFATSEDKLDVVSQALEYGCVSKSGGGCKVRNEVIWKAIDDVT